MKSAAGYTREEIDRKRVELQQLLREVDQLHPAVRDIVAGSDFGKDAMAKAERTITRAKDALSGKNDLDTILAAHDQLTRTLALFRGVIQRIGNAGRG